MMVRFMCMLSLGVAKVIQSDSEKYVTSLPRLFRGNEEAFDVMVLGQYELCTTCHEHTR